MRSAPHSIDKIYKYTLNNTTPDTLKEVLRILCPELSNNKVNGLLHRGQVALNGNVTRQFDTPVKSGDNVEINFGRPFVRFSHPRLDIIYEDNDIIVVNKGYGLLSVGRGSGSHEKTAYNLLRDYLKTKDPALKLFIIHRLDRDTSGLMMFAKSIEAKENMQHNWKNMVLERKYVAVVEGELQPDTGTYRSWLGETSAHEVYSTQIPSEDGNEKLAVTHWEVLARGAGRSLVDFALDTGRKNQIRVHSRELGHPIVGDRRYGAGISPIGRMALHASTLRFAHPINRKQMNFTLPIPDKFTRLVHGARLDKKLH